jgi:simple sugar transport system substrate-binding protein
MKKLSVAAFALAVFLPGANVALADVKPVKVTYIQHCCEGQPFWQPFQFGANEAAKMFGVNLTYVNAENDIAKQANIIETAIAQKQDAVIIMISVPHALNDAVKKAKDAGLIVIAANVDDPEGAKGNGREAFIGPSLFAPGEIMAQHLIDVAKLGKGDHCLLPVEFPEMNYATERAKGAEKALDAAGVTYETIGTGVDEAQAQTVIAQALTANPKITCVAALGGVALQVAPAAMAEAGRKILPNAGFETIPQVLDNIKSGRTLFTLDQQPFWQGFLPVMYAAFQKRYGLAPPPFSDTGNLMVDSSNLDLVLKYAGTYR